MRQRALYTLLLIKFSLLAAAQAPGDTVRLLDEVAIEAYVADRLPRDIPASVHVVLKNDFLRFSEGSLLPAFNMLPGIRMEERSPGSYRFSIRGSLIRSPFGVRNVKFYWNGLPLTDGGGNNYLNLLDLYTISRAEVIKGPAGSLYGAGTGGTVLLRSPALERSSVGVTAQGGSFGTFRYGALLEAKSEYMESRVQFVSQQSDGYREHSAMNRNAFNADMNFATDPSTLISFSFLYSDLKYETPGGLTEAQYEDNPKQARPASPTTPGATDQQAAVNNKTLFSGITLEHQWSRQWSSTLGIVGSSTDFRNPSIRNYETRDEKNLGVRLSNRFAPTSILRIVFGGEYQHLNSAVTVTYNASGIPGTNIISNDNITTGMAMGFGQIETTLPLDIELTAGISLNYVEYRDQRLVLSPPQTETRKFNPELLPRVAVLKKLTDNLSVYLSASRGYSPPSVAEVVPSTGIYNSTLNPETGWSYETGVSGTIGKSVDFHLALYDFRLESAIVLQRDSTGADYFVNAGDIRQQGIELNATWTKQYTTWIKTLRIFTSLSYSHFHFGQYVNDGNDNSGNAVTGVPPWVVVLGVDVSLRSGWYINLTGNFTDRLPLNDANTAYASDYFLLGARTGYRTFGKLPVDFFIGVDNLLNQRYSLGNDLNAGGGRYYNAAPTTNYYVGLTAQMPFLR